MIHGQFMKTQSLVAPISALTNATQTANIDTKGYDYCTILVHADTAADATNKLITTGILLKESDDTVVSNFATISGHVAGTDYTVPAPSTSVANVYRFGVDCRARKRYLRIALTPLGAATLMSAEAVLERAERAPTTTTEQGTVLTFNI